MTLTPDPMTWKAHLTVLVLACCVVCAYSEGDNSNNEYLRFGRAATDYSRLARNDPFLRFGRQDPFLRFGKQDPFLRFGREDPFLRFGREDPFLRFGRNDPYLRFGRDNDPYLRFGRDNDPYLRFGRDNDPYLRFGKNDPFLRFGKSVEATAEADGDAVTVSREHGFLEENDSSDRRKRSVTSEADHQNQHRYTREVPDLDKLRDRTGQQQQALREPRNPPYMRFGKKSQAEPDQWLQYEFSRFLRNYDGRLTLPRFGKRDNQLGRKQEYMRFGRSAELD